MAAFPSYVQVQPEEEPISSAPSRTICSSRCSPATAARTSLLSRRWSRLTGFTFHDVAPRLLRPALDSLLDVLVPDAAALLLHCPRLRVLRATGCSFGHPVRSASLQELILENKGRSTGRVHVDVPALKQLTLSMHTRGDLRLSISAPMVEKALWRCCYSKAAAGIGPWGLAMVSFETAGSNALCLWMESDDSSLGSFSFPQTELSLAQEIEKHLVVTNFSVLDLHFNTTGHAFGAFVFPLLGIHWILSATRILKIGLVILSIA